MDNKSDFDSDYWDDVEMEYLKKHPHGSTEEDRPTYVLWAIFLFFACVAVCCLVYLI